MKKSRFFYTALVFILAFSFVACGIPAPGGNNSTSGSGNGAAAPAPKPASPTAEPEKKADPCPCCPDCTEEECECAVCGGNDEYGCVCEAPGLGGNWKIVFTDVTDSAPQAGAEGMFAQDITLCFEAEGVVENNFSGQFSGIGKMMGTQDSSGYEALAQGLITVNSDWAGPIFPVTFEVTDLNSATQDGGDDPAALTPPDLNEKLLGHAKFSATVDGTMGPTWYQENVLGTGMDLGTGSGFTLECGMQILIYDGGTAILCMTVPGLVGTLTYRGTVSRG